jgi:4'-phosphopantetheinyl transferase
LAGTGQKQGIGFNLAHTDNLALLAVRAGGEIGVDVEQVRPIPDMEELVARFFSANENALFKTLPVKLRGAAFFNLWTRKEAWLKATGEGIASSLRSVEVSFLPGEPACLVRIEGKPEEPGRWRLEDLKPAPGFAAAVAIPGEATEVSCRRWRPDEIQKREGAL